jgi:hypothetical protein
VSQENVSGDRMRSRTESLLHRAFLTAKGRSDGFEFAWDHRNNLTAIKAEIEEQLELFVDLQAGPLATGTGPRLYKDSYVIALQEALNILQKGEDL